MVRYRSVDAGTVLPGAGTAEPQIAVQQGENGMSSLSATPKESWVHADGSLNHNKFIGSPSNISWISDRVRSS